MSSKPIRVPSWFTATAVAACLWSSFAAADNTPTPPARSPSWPGYEELNRRRLNPMLLPGQKGFVFTLYGAPDNLETLRQLVGVMTTNSLGNGFDPGPGPHANSRRAFEFLATVGWPVVFYSGGEMQIKGGRSVMGRTQADLVAPLDAAGIFTAYQIGEWGYYLHNLAHNESWWRSVYGAEFDSFKHLMKPAGLAGYERRPTSKRECYDYVRDYFISRRRDLLSRVISVTGHSHYEAYAGEWGAECIGLEVAENIAFTQSKFAFARGASRAWAKPWSVQVSPWFHGSCTTSGPMRTEGGIARGLDAGHSLSLYERMWLHGWFSGAAMVTPENSIAIFFEKPEPPWNLTSHAAKASEVFQLARTHDRGIPFTPVAIVLDHLAGYNGYMDKPWGILPPSEGDRELRDLFDYQLFPGADHIHTKPNPNNPESSYLRPTPFGEIFDVLLTSAPSDRLSAYETIILAGDIEFDTAFLGELDKALRKGRKVILSERHRRALGPEFERLAKEGAVEVAERWVNPDTQRGTAISNTRLRQLATELLPIHVEGAGVQYQVNRVASGWVVEVINNEGVAKKPNQPAVVDAGKQARVTLRPRFQPTAAKEWRSGREHHADRPIELTLGPGEVCYLEFQQ